MGERKLEQINSALVNSFTTRKLQGDSDGSGKLAPKTVRDIDTILKSIHKYGENEYHTGPLADNTVLPKNLIKVLLAEDMFICRVSLVNRRK